MNEGIKFITIIPEFLKFHYIFLHLYPKVFLLLICTFKGLTTESQQV